MKRTRIIGGAALFILVSLAWTNSSIGGEETGAAESARIADLIRLLGADDFHVREKASRELLRIGLPARPALRRAVGDADLEIQKRCRELLPAIAEADLRAKLAAFVADKEGKQEHDLPGWKRYRKIVGEDEAARLFFVALQKADTGLLAESEKNPAQTGTLCASYCQNMWDRQQIQQRSGIIPTPFHAEEIASLMLLTTDSTVSIPSPQRWQFSNLLHQQTVRSELQSKRSTPFRKIVWAWMERQVEDDATAHTIFTTINGFEIKEGLDLALKAVRSKKLHGSSIAHALTTIGRMGDKSHLHLLESCLEDKTNFCGFSIGRLGGNVQGNTEVRDVALAMLIRLTDQPLKDYGFAITKANFEHMKDEANFLGFSSDKEREAALAKWKTWKIAKKK